MDSENSSMYEEGGYQNNRGPPAKRSRAEGGMDNFLERKDENLAPNRILLMTVKDTKFPINVEVIHKVCSIIGPVNKIVCFERNTIVQAMVEFDDLDNANKARASFHGCDVYHNCCTMKVEYSKLETLKVRENGPMSWDFTRGEGPVKREGGRTTILSDPEMGGAPIMGGGRGPAPDFGGMRNMDMMGGMGGPDHRRGGYDMGEGMGMGGGMGYGGERSSVVVFHNLAVGEVNCDRLFNLVCQYGNVSKIFFMKTKAGCAMVEMGDWEAAQRLCSNLQGVELFSNKLQLDLSKKHMKITNAPLEWEMQDGTSSVKDFFSTSRLNRFTNEAMAKKNRILAPTKVVHFYGIPKCTDAEVEDVFTEYCAPQPNKIKWVEAKRNPEIAAKEEASGRAPPGMGLAYFDTVAAATEALVLVNHRQIEGRTIKLCFSPATF